MSTEAQVDGTGWGVVEEAWRLKRLGQRDERERPDHGWTALVKGGRYAASAGVWRLRACEACLLSVHRTRYVR